jgi:hypothetical protein
MTDRLKVTELDFDAIKTNLKNFLRQQSEFQDYDFEGSGLNVLLDVLAYNTHYNAYYTNMVANESFMDTALLRNSVVSHAKKLGYTPRSTKSSRAVVNVTIDSGDTTPGVLTIPKGYNFISNELDNSTYNFTTLETHTTSKIGQTFVFDNVTIYEGQLVSYVFTQSNLSNPKQIFTLPDQNIDTDTLIVTVRNSEANTDFTVYTKAEDVITVSSDDTVYYIQEGLNGQYQVYFGSDVYGKKIPDGSVLTFQYIVCNGSVPNGSNNFVATTSVSGFSNIVVDSISPAFSGIERESVDDIKFAAPLQNISQNRAVTKNDYIKLIQQKYPFFEAVNVWGGEENDPPVFGKVFISAKPADGFEVSETVKQFVIENILKPISILTVTPEIVDVDYNYLRINSSVYYNKSKTTLSDEEIKSTVRQAILNYTDENLNQFNTYFNYSGLERAVQDLSTSFVSNEIDFFVGKKFRPNLLTTNSYILDFGFELQRGTTNKSFFSTPDFTMLDSRGIRRKCFFEEIPSSFTGVESIVILNGGFNYTTTPTVEIVGDGQGAKAVATIVNGKVARIQVTNPGIGYTVATVRIIGGGGSTAQASAVLQGRFGRIRISYFRPDEVTSEQTKVVLNASVNDGVVGEIDYVLGKITIIDFNPVAVNNDFGDITVYCTPESNIIQSKFNKMLVLDSTDPSSVVVKTVQIT